MTITPEFNAARYICAANWKVEQKTFYTGRTTPHVIARRFFAHILFTMFHRSPREIVAHFERGKNWWYQTEEAHMHMYNSIPPYKANYDWCCEQVQKLLDANHD